MQGIITKVKSRADQDKILKSLDTLDVPLNLGPFKAPYMLLLNNDLSYRKEPESNEYKYHGSYLYYDVPVLIDRITDKEFFFITDKIKFEIKKAKEKYPNFADTIIEALCIINEETGEATQAANNFYHHDGSIEEVEKELLHAAGTIFRALSEIKKGNIKSRKNQ